MARITAQEAERRLNKYMEDKGGKQRTIPPVNRMIQEMIRKEPVFCFNVGPWGDRINMGSFGYYFIPACVVGAPMEWNRLPAAAAASGVYVPDLWEEGQTRITEPKKQYAAFRPLPGLMLEPMPKDQDTCEWNMQDEGKYFAEQLLGVGIGHDINQSWLRRGCFIGAGEKPTPQELTAARTELMKFMKASVLEADRAWAQGPLKAEQIIRPEIHHICADWMNLKDRAWIRGTDPAVQAECPACGENVKTSAMTCKSCGFVLDKTKYDQAKKDGLFV
jgi:hypothetical protein